jgi:hypothetical protein
MKNPLPGERSSFIRAFGLSRGRTGESLWAGARIDISEGPTVYRDKNGEEGTVSAGDYQKGDSAAFFVSEASDKLSNESGALGDVVQKGAFLVVDVDRLAKVCSDWHGCHTPAAISQKGDNLSQNFRILKTSAGPAGPNGAQYFVVEFR